MTTLGFLTIVCVLAPRTDAGSPAGKWIFDPADQSNLVLKFDPKKKHKFPVMEFKDDHTFELLNGFEVGTWYMSRRKIIVTFKKHPTLLGVWKAKKEGTTNQTEMVLSHDKMHLEWWMQNHSMKRRMPLKFVKIQL